MIQINLIPDIKIAMVKARAQRIKVISISIAASLVSIAVVVLLALYTYGAQAIADTNLNKQIDEESSKLSSIKDISKILTIQNQLSAIPKINSQKTINSRIFDTIASVKKYSGDVVSYSSINIDTNLLNFAITGQVPSYASYEVFIKTLQNSYVQYKTSETDEFQKKPFANSLNTGQSNLGQNSFGNNVLNFSVSFTYPNEVFDPNLQQVSIMVEKYGNVTDSYLGVPTSLFTKTNSSQGL